MQNCPRQLAMQSCVLCSFVRCGTSKQIEKKKKKKEALSTLSEHVIKITAVNIAENTSRNDPLIIMYVPITNAIMDFFMINKKGVTINALFQIHIHAL